MKYYSTNNREFAVSLQDAVLTGLAPDHGLFMPAQIPIVDGETLRELKHLSFQDLAFRLASPYLDAELTSVQIEDLVQSAFSFPVPLREIEPGLFVLELFHGPTLAFKDFGARFLARLVAHFRKESDRQLTVLVATSGDTGSAVAQGFSGIPGIRVVLLYPKGMVSVIQEQQLTTAGHNVSALEVEGTFDDCQRLVKIAFADRALRQQIDITSANSINIGRLLPQSFYYFAAAAQLAGNAAPQFAVPCGNLGNLTAGVLAKRMGLDISRFFAATNANDIFVQYLQSGAFLPRQAVGTIANAMDVGNPNNMPRLLNLYDNDLEAMKADINGAAFSDSQTRAEITDVFKRTGYVLDPHTAVGLLAARASRDPDSPTVVLATAHPAKFADTVGAAIGKELELPPALNEALKKQKNAAPLRADYFDLQEVLLD